MMRLIVLRLELQFQILLCCKKCGMNSSVRRESSHGPVLTADMSGNALLFANLCGVTSVLDHCKADRGDSRPSGRAYDVAWISSRPSKPITGVRIPVRPLELLVSNMKLNAPYRTEFW